MKKLAFLLAVVFLSVATFGQTTTTALKKAPQKQAVKTEQVKTTAKTTTAATDKTVTTTKAAVDTTKHLKKDGTADKRFKTTAKTTGPVKKDGTPDMRYKENKAAATTTTAPKK
jgi:hypothetical protein